MSAYPGVREFNSNASATSATSQLFAFTRFAFGPFLCVPHVRAMLVLQPQNMIMQLLGMFAVLIGGPLLFFNATEHYENGQLNPEAYPPFALTAFWIMVVGVWVSAIGTHSYIPKLPQAQTDSRFSPLAVASDLVNAFKIRAFSAVVTASIVAGMNQGMVQALILYTGTYFFELTPNQLQFL